MSNSSKIEWTDATWNPVTGCTKVSDGCTNCYAVQMSRRLAAMGQEKYAGLVVPGAPTKDGFTPEWSGKVVCHDSALAEPFKWAQPQMVFVCSMSDLFHDQVPWDFLIGVFATMRLASQHTYQALTKRPGRMAYFANVILPRWYDDLPITLEALTEASRKRETYPNAARWWPSNVWAGTSVESQKYAPRLDVLARVPAPVRFVSAEPLLSALDLTKWLNWTGDGGMHEPPNPPAISWCIVGGESGPHARPMQEEWVRDLRNQCQSAGVAFFYKQAIISGKKIGTPSLDGRQWMEFPDALQRPSKSKSSSQ